MSKSAIEERSTMGSSIASLWKYNSSTYEDWMSTSWYLMGAAHASREDQDLHEEFQFLHDISKYYAIKYRIAE